MSRRFRNIFANLTSIILTIAILSGIGAYLFYQRETLLNFSVFNANSGLNEEVQNAMSQSERIDEKQVEQEMNRIAEEKRKKEEALKRVEEERKRKAEEERRRKAEEARKKKEAAEKAEKERLAREERIRLEKEAKLKKAQEETARQEKEKQDAIEKARKEATEARLKREAEAEAQRQRQEKQAAEKAERERQAQITAANEAKINAALNSGYTSQVHNYIYQSWQPPMIDVENLSATVTFNVDLNGNIQGRPAIKASSGNTSFDESVIIAIMRASPLPMPNEPLARQKLVKEGFEVEFIPRNFL